MGQTPQLARTVLLIAGMRDNVCREQLTTALEKVAGVREVDVNLYRARASIVHEPGCNVGELVAAVLRAGYFATPAEGARRPESDAPLDGGRPSEQDGEEGA